MNDAQASELTNVLKDISKKLQSIDEKLDTIIRLNPQPLPP